MSQTTICLHHCTCSMVLCYGFLIHNATLLSQVVPYLCSMPSTPTVAPFDGGRLITLEQHYFNMPQQWNGRVNSASIHLSVLLGRLL
jgi:hypothetical protein